MFIESKESIYIQWKIKKTYRFSFIKAIWCYAWQIVSSIDILETTTNNQ